ncbi:MAG: SET domain-containing protein [Candidatus Roizmanbacteria bacterium]|nr:SET domain-containing protein [Candidatus Roizmanbacteria bacterium]
MKNNNHSNTKIVIQVSTIPNAGRGIFTSKPIKAGEIIEICPVIILPQKDYPLIKQTLLRNYYFMWGTNTVAICLGYGSLYNHSYTPNATYMKKIKEKTIEFIALRDVKKNEEILVNYNYGNPDDKRVLWIEDIA